MPVLPHLLVVRMLQNHMLRMYLVVSTVHAPNYGVVRLSPHSDFAAFACVLNLITCSRTVLCAMHMRSRGAMWRGAVLCYAQTLLIQVEVILCVVGCVAFVLVFFVGIRICVVVVRAWAWRGACATSLRARGSPELGDIVAQRFDQLAAWLQLEYDLGALLQHVPLHSPSGSARKRLEGNVIVKRPVSRLSA
jgi:hypothetical protein